MSISFNILRDAIRSVSFREDLVPLIDEVKESRASGRINIMEEQELLKYIDERMQIPSRPPTRVTAVENVTPNNAVASMPPSHPVLTSHAANFNNNDFQIIVDGGRRSRRRSTRRITRHRRRSTRRSTRRNRKKLAYA